MNFETFLKDGIVEHPSNVVIDGDINDQILALLQIL